MRTAATGVLGPSDANGLLKIDLGDRIMAAIASSNGREPRVASASRLAAPPSSGRQRLPWLGLLGALAAGLLVTVVINFPRDNGREVALAPVANKDRGAFAQKGARRESTEQTGGRDTGVAKEGEDRLAVADAEAEGRVGDELLLQERYQDGDLKGLVPSEAPPMDALAADASRTPALGKTLGGRADTPNGEAIATASGGGRGLDSQFSAAPTSAPAPSAPPPAAVSVPEAGSSQLAESRARPEGQGETAAVARQVGKRMKVDLAGVLVIAVTNPSERRALDRLVAESGLDATPDRDHLALVGKATDIDAFLQELTRVGLVAAVPARRAAEAGKQKAAEKKSDARQATLILRVVERKGRPAVPAQASEAEATPEAEAKPSAETPP
jgi:hypothetical protein